MCTYLTDHCTSLTSPRPTVRQTETQTTAGFISTNIEPRIPCDRPRRHHSNLPVHSILCLCLCGCVTLGAHATNSTLSENYTGRSMAILLCCVCSHAITTQTFLSFAPWCGERSSRAQVTCARAAQRASRSTDWGQHVRVLRSAACTYVCAYVVVRPSCQLVSNNPSLDWVALLAVFGFRACDRSFVNNTGHTPVSSAPQCVVFSFRPLHDHVGVVFMLINPVV